jgi:hypothetical protein
MDILFIIGLNRFNLIDSRISLVIKQNGNNIYITGEIMSRFVMWTAKISLLTSSPSLLSTQCTEQLRTKIGLADSSHILRGVSQILPYIISQILPQINSHKTSSESRLTTVTIFTATIIVGLSRTVFLILCIYTALYSFVFGVEKQYTNSINTLSIF